METALQAIKSQLQTEKQAQQTTLMISTKRLIKQLSKILQKDPSDIKIIDSNGDPINGKIDLGSCKGFCPR